MILEETFNIIKSKISLHKISINSIFLSNYFNIVQLNDSSVGACFNYLKFKSEKDTLNTHNSLIKKLQSDPLLLRYLFNDNGNNKDLLKLNLKTCLISALSRNLILDPTRFNINYNLDLSIFSDINSAVIIGFGGYMDFIVRETQIKKVHITDLSYDQRKDEMDRRIIFYKKNFPDKLISVSNGSDNKERIESSDLVSITGSAFCNGTMDELLDYSKDCKKIIIQGESVSIYPEALFRKRVSLISTSIKPTNLLQIAYSGLSRLQSLLEKKQGLPQIYITPKVHYKMEFLDHTPREAKRT